MRRSTAALVAVTLTVTAAPSVSSAFAGTPAAGSATVTATAPSLAPAVDDRPNVVLITTDDQTVADLDHMPFTRRFLGDQGVTFANAISPFPLCCPARATILTGQLAHNHGVLSNKGPEGGWQAMRELEPRSLPVWLERAGYRTSFAGKYLNQYGTGGSLEVPPGWTDWRAATKRVYDYYGNVVNENGTLVDRTGEYQPQLAQAATADAIRSATTLGQPFFVWQSDLAPHRACPRGPKGGCRWKPPPGAPQDEDRFTKLPLASQKKASFDERVMVDKPDRLRKRDPLSVGQVKSHIANHRGRVRSLQAVDRNVRATVRLLERLGQLDNSYVILASDNGFLLGEHRFGGKILPYEESLRIPMLMRGPGLPTGRKVRRTVSLVDVAATIAQVTGAKPQLRLDGKSLVDVATGASGYQAVGIEAGSVLGAKAGNRFYEGVRTKRYTYVEYPGSGEAELYDRRRDPQQLVNVAYRGTHRATRRAMRDLLAQTRTCAGDECHTVSGSVPAPKKAQAAVHPDELGSLGRSRQVVTVTAARQRASTGRAVAWEKRGRAWVVRRRFDVRLGRAGVDLDPVPRAQDSTPAGTFAVRRAMGLRRDPGTALPYDRVDRNDRMSLDPQSRDTFNVVQPFRSAKATWRAKFEEVFSKRPKVYRHALNLNHNVPRKVSWAPGRRQREADRPARPRLGSLLVHAGNRVPGQGWVAIPRKRLTWMLRWMQPTRHPKVVLGTPKYLRRHL